MQLAKLHNNPFELTQVHSRTARLEYDGHIFSVDPMTLAMTRHYEEEQPPTTTDTMKHQWYVILAVVLAVVLSLVAVAIAVVS